MIYPIAVLSIAVIVVMVILWKVVPTFTSLFEGLNATLPLADPRRHLREQAAGRRACRS